LDAALVALGARQHGVVSHAQLVELGFGNAAIQRRTNNQRLHRLHRGVYAVGHPGLTLRGRELAAVFACGPRAVLSHRSAGRLWGLLPTGSGGIEVSAPRSRQPRPGLRVHTSRCLTAEDRAVVKAIPVTSVARTLVDLAEALSEPWLARAVHEAEVRKLFDLIAVEEALERVPGRRGRSRLMGVLAAYRPEDHVLESAAERRFRALCQRHGLPEPRPQLIEGHRVDFYWPEALLAVEVDGAAFHHTRRAFHADRARDRALAALGIQVLRVTWPDLDRDRALASELRGALSARTLLARHRPGPFEVTPAAHADLVVQGHPLAALGARTHGLAPFHAVEDRRDGAQYRKHQSDQEPEEKRGALELSDHRRRQAAEEGEGDVLHRRDPLAQGGDRPDDGDDREDHHREPGNRGHGADHEFEEDPDPHQQHRDRDELSADVRSELTHTTSVAGG
jgi:very-short-patch-repair endonuclease